MKSLDIFQSTLNPIKEVPYDVSNKFRVDYGFERVDGELVVVEKGKVNVDKAIQQEKGHAGLQYILQQAKLKYGSIENAIYHNEEDAIYGDISNIPSNYGDQVEAILKSQSEAYKLAKKYGLSMDEFYKLDSKAIVALVEKANAPQEQSKEGE